MDASSEVRATLSLDVQGGAVLRPLVKRGVELHAARSEGRWASPYIRYDGWTVDEALDLHSSREVSAENWAELGRLFVEYFDDDKLRRE